MEETKENRVTASKILIPVDGDAKRSARAVQMGADMALAFGAEVRLVACLEPVPAYLHRAEEMAQAHRAAAEDWLARHFDELDNQNVTWTKRVLLGSAAAAIVDEAKSWGADLISMASTHKSDLAGLVLGSVTHGVLHLNPCPVLVV